MSRDVRPNELQSVQAYHHNDCPVCNSEEPVLTMDECVDEIKTIINKINAQIKKGE